MKLIQQFQVSPGRFSLGPCRSLRAKEISGTVKAIIDGETITLVEGDTFECPLGVQFKTVDIFVADGAAGVIDYGFVSFGGGGGGGSASGQLLTGDGPPTAPPDDANGAGYYYDYTNVSIYNWSVPSQAWV